MAPPMSGDTVVLFWSGGKLYMCPVYTLWDSFETALVTGSPLSVAANCHLLDTVHIGDGVRERPAARQTRSRLPN